MNSVFPVVHNEEDRLEVVESCGLLDTPDDPRFDRLTRLAAYTTDAPIALVSLVATYRQWFKSRHGLAVRETPREFAFCNYALVEPAGFVVEDATTDDRFKDNPLVTGAPHIRFYAGMPIAGSHGHRLGTLCVIDTVARRLTPVQRRLLQDLAAIASDVVQMVEHEVGAR